MRRKKNTVLVAGATGYLGTHIAKVLQREGIPSRLIERTSGRLKEFEGPVTEVVQAEITKKTTIKGVCDGIETVISTVGITRQKDGMTYMDVDFQANMNLLEEAKKSGVRKFIYVSAINGDKHRNLKIFEAKEKFVDELKKSGLEYTIVRPNGFFSDMKDFMQMAKKGRVYLFGSGKQLLNPIHGEDLAEACVGLIEDSIPEITLGGPDVLTQNEIAELAFIAMSKPVKITHLPDWMRRFTIWFVRTFMNSKTYGPIEFFLTMMAEDTVAPRYGKIRLREFFKQVVKEEANVVSK